ncbi:unnamed protein product [Amoebophrya sp. A120]|nr:unnamed protein product [Amoebophrya sp. A120]|eukprot:GSA120T00001998001.1
MRISSTYACAAVSLATWQLWTGESARLQDTKETLARRSRSQSVLSLLRSELKKETTKMRRELREEVTAEVSADLAQKKFMKDWHPKMAFVQYKRQDCTNGLHALMVEFPCLTELAKKSIEDSGVQETTILSHYNQTVLNYLPPGRTEFCRWGKPKKHAIIKKSEAGTTALQLDLAAEMCSKNKDCGGFVHFNEDVPAPTFPTDGLELKVRKPGGSATGSVEYVTHVQEDGTTPQKAKPGDIVFLISAADCAAILFDPLDKTKQITQTKCDELAADASNPRTCKTGCVRASHCVEDQKENTYIKKRIIMADFGSETEEYLKRDDMYEGSSAT